MEGSMLNSELWYELHRIVDYWVVDHPKLQMDDLVDDLHDFVLQYYGPPF